MRYNSGYESIGFDAFDRGAQGTSSMCFCKADDIRGINPTLIDSISAYVCNDNCLEEDIATLDCAIAETSSNFSELIDTDTDIKISVDNIGGALKALADKIGYKINDDWTVGLKAKGVNFNWGGMKRLTRSQLKTL